MEYKEIKQLMEDMENSNLSSLDISLPDGTKINIKKDIEKNVKEYNESNKKINIKNENNHIDFTVQNNKQENEIENKNILKSPMVGTFYLKPSPTSAPYVEIGKEVKKGDTLCIIEAMKLMNEIESEYDGKIAKILVKDGEPVEYGTQLFVIE